jgi:hypothetical protein
MKVGYKLTALLVTAAVTWWGLPSLVHMLPAIGGRYWTIIILSFSIALLLVLIGMIKTFHDTTVGDLNEEMSTRLDNVRTLTKVVSRADILRDSCQRIEDIPSEKFAALLTEAREALSWCRSTPGAIEFYGTDRFKILVSPNGNGDRSTVFKSEVRKLSDLLHQEQYQRDVELRKTADQEFLVALRNLFR